MQVATVVLWLWAIAGAACAVIYGRRLARVSDTQQIRVFRLALLKFLMMCSIAFVLTGVALQLTVSEDTRLMVLRVVVTVSGVVAAFAGAFGVGIPHIGLGLVCAVSFVAFAISFAWGMMLVG